MMFQPIRPFLFSILILLPSLQHAFYIRPDSGSDLTLVVLSRGQRLGQIPIYISGQNFRYGNPGYGGYPNQGQQLYIPFDQGQDYVSFLPFEDHEVMPHRHHRYPPGHPGYYKGHYNQGHRYPDNTRFTGHYSQGNRDHVRDKGHVYRGQTEEKGHYTPSQTGERDHIHRGQEKGHHNQRPTIEHYGPTKTHHQGQEESLSSHAEEKAHKGHHTDDHHDHTDGHIHWEHFYPDQTHEKDHVDFDRLIGDHPEEGHGGHDKGHTQQGQRERPGLITFGPPTYDYTRDPHPHPDSHAHDDHHPHTHDDHSHPHDDHHSHAHTRTRTPVDILPSGGHIHGEEEELADVKRIIEANAGVTPQGETKSQLRRAENDDVEYRSKINIRRSSIPG